jgi:hypothetical protein
VARLPEPHNSIVVVVAFRHTSLPSSGETVANNFVVTAWGDVSASSFEE